MAQRSLAIGLASAVGVIFVWSGFVVFSRAGMQTAMTAYDLNALRFMVSGAVVAPFAYAWWPRGLSWPATAFLALTGPGGIYAVTMFLGLERASAAYGGVFANGFLPLFTMAIAVIAERAWPSRRQVAAVAVILIGGGLLAARGMAAGGADIVSGIALLLTASAVLSAYLYGVQRWDVTPRQALAVITIPNVVLFIPLWYLFLPSGLDRASPWEMAAHGLFQGLGPGFLAVILIALMVRHLGPTITAGISATVPASAALLAIPVLGEIPEPLEWAGIAVVSIGLAILIRKAENPAAG